ncbi:MAG: glucosyltransferase domain-containing protein [Bacilli bacterium]|nr:glucosyltransferase domain-containing protein [Bacilli bacterium]
MKKELLKKENWVFVILFVFLFFVHLPLMTKPILTADVLLNNTYYQGYSWEISLGRFGLYIFGLLKGFISVPSFELFLSFLLIVLITFFIMKLFGIDDKISKLFTVLLMTLSPIISATLLFHYCSVPYLAAFLCGVLSVYCFYEGKNKWTRYCLPILFVVVSLSMYQAYLSLIITTFILFQIKLLVDHKMNFKKSGMYLLLCIFGIVLYLICMKISLFIFHIDMASYSNANQIGVSTFLNFPKKFIESYQLFYQMYFTNQITKNTYFYHTWIHIGIFLSFILSVGYKLIKSTIPLLHKILVVILILLIPVFLNCVIFVIADSKLQLLMSASYLVFFIFLLSFPHPRFIKLFICILFGLLFRNYWIQDQATYMTLEETYSTYYTVIDGAIKSHMNQLDQPFIVIGEIKNTNHNLTNKNYGYISDEGLFWTEYNLRKLGFERFCRQAYGLDIKYGEEKDYLTYQSDFNPDLVYEKDGNIIINLNHYTK